MVVFTRVGFLLISHFGVHASEKGARFGNEMFQLRTFQGQRRKPAGFQGICKRCKAYCSSKLVKFGSVQFFENRM